MPYDLFISYSRRDNAQGRVTQLVERIQADFAAFAGLPLQPFFDLTEIQGMDDWRHRILQALRESRLPLRPARQAPIIRGVVATRPVSLCSALT